VPGAGISRCVNMSSLPRLCLIVAATALVACEFDSAGVSFPAEGDDSEQPDSGLPRPLDEPEGQDFGPGPACRDWSSRHFDACEIPEPEGALSLFAAGEWVFDTDTGTLEDPLGLTDTLTSVLVAQIDESFTRVISVDGLTVAESARLRVVGSIPLVIASWSSIAVDGTIDVGSSREGGARGAGADSERCESQAPTGGEDSFYGGGGGGGGAGFGDRGGSGGDGSSADSGAGGAASLWPSMVRGGCAGASGGSGRSMSAEGGSGGGALHLAARDEIRINGAVLANGAGGRGGGRAFYANGDDGEDGNGHSEYGGGGGGSGGLVGLEAASVVLGSAAVLAANGGGGGEGGDREDGGAPGSDGLSAKREAPGGAGYANQGGDGGGGGFDFDPGGDDALDGGQGGGGGGGGGAGFIVLEAGSWYIPVSAVVTPAPIAP